MRILQFGCNDAKDELFEFISKNTSHIDYILLVDANPYAVELAKIRYASILPQEKFYILNQAIVCDPSLTTVDLYIPNKEKWSGHSSLFKELTAMNWGEDLSVLKVPAATPDYFIDLIGMPIDQLHIDVEGLDADILMYINLEKYPIKTIIFEAAHTDGHFTRSKKYEECINKLVTLGYSLSALPNGLDILAVKQ